jgi:hypothetical protein
VHARTDAARAEAERRFVEPLRAHLAAAGLGHVSEIADADAPFTPRGCPFQAWSLGELVRMTRLLGEDAAGRYHPMTARSAPAAALTETGPPAVRADNTPGTPTVPAPATSVARARRAMRA